ncbi:MAG: hypothetical protein HY748_07165 [Elusimicrobia bacterium]|nr:hypothetical protein [Elusimicrobiota bacterium]
MRRAFLLTLALGFAALVAVAYLIWSFREFRVSGTITIASHLHRRVPQGQVVLFVIAKNKGGVPIAMQRIVNPQFPVSFHLRNADLIVPDSRVRDAMILQAQMNTHGQAGHPQPGDLEGSAKDLVLPGERDTHIVIDKEL